MAQRGRKSAASLSVIPFAGVVRNVVERPAPPDYLSEAAAAEWRAIVDRMPADYFLRESWPLLAQMCRHIVLSNSIAATLDEDAASLSKEPELLDKLTKIHEREGRAISSIATRLRLTHQSRYADRVAHTAAKESAEPRPWEIKRPA